MSGTYGSIGRTMLSGALLAVNEIASDPTYDFTFKPLVRDPGGNLARYFSLCQELLHEHAVTHVVGCYTSSSRKEVVPLFERANALLWYPSHYEGFECSENVIYVGASPNQHLAPLSDYMMSTHGKRIYAIGSNYVWSWESNRVMREIAEVRGGRLLAERYVPVGATDVKWIVEEIRALKPDFVFSSLIGASVPALLHANVESLCEAHIPLSDAPPIASCNLCEMGLQAVRGEARVGHICSSVYFQSIESAANRAFVERYRSRYGPASITSADGEASYIAVHLLAEAIRACGTTNVNRVREIVSTCRLDAPQGPVRIDPENQHSYLTPRLGRSMKNGQFEIMYTSEGPVKPDPYLAWFDAGHDAGGGRGENTRRTLSHALPRAVQ